MELNAWDYFEIRFDPNPSGTYLNGYWTCYAEPGYDGSGSSPLEAMAECMIAMSKALIEQSNADKKNKEAE